MNFYYVFPFQQNNDIKDDILVSVVSTEMMIPGKTQCYKCFRSNLGKCTMTSIGEKSFFKPNPK